MKSLLTVSDILTRICDMAARFAAVLLVALVFVIIYDVIGRKFFATGSVLLQELEWHLHGVIAVFALGYAYTRDAHVRIDVLATRMTQTFRYRLEFWVILLLVCPFLLLIAWHGYDFAERAFVRGEGAPGGRGLPYRWIIKSAVPASALLTVSGCLAVAIRIHVTLRRPDLVTDPFISRPLWKF